MVNAAGVSVEHVRAQVEILKTTGRRSAAGTDQQLYNALVEDSIICRQAGRLDAALSRGMEVIACVEMNRRAMGEEQRALHAFALANVASALHMLGHCSVAKQLYEQSHAELSSAPRMLLDQLCGCTRDVRREQLDYIASRAVLAADGHVPSARCYLDGLGVEKTWSDAEVAEAQARAAQIEAELQTNKPPPLNMGSLSGVSHKSYPITSTPRKELW